MQFTINFIILDRDCLKYKWRISMLLCDILFEISLEIPIVVL